MKIHLLSFFCLLLFSGCKTKKVNAAFDNGALIIKKLGENTYQHTSYLKTKSFGNFPCNGMIVINGGEALVIDTPSYNEDSKTLIKWIEKKMKAKIVGVIATHFHIDCLGGLAEFHKNEIPSYATNKTMKLAGEDSREIPKNGFDDFLELKVGNEKIINEFIGEGHTKDNIVSYFPADKVLFGGCLVKAIGAGKGNLNDANVQLWSKTVEQVKAKYGEAKTVIPGHGKPGGIDLLDFTIEMFKTN